MIAIKHEARHGHGDREGGRGIWPRICAVWRGRGVLCALLSVTASMRLHWL